MAKEEAHSWARYIMLGIVIIFACGGYAIKVTDNTAKIKEEADINKVQTGQIHSLQLADKDIKNIAEKSLDTMVLMNSKLETIQTTQAKQATIQAVNSEKLKTLTKD